MKYTIWDQITDYLEDHFFLAVLVFIIWNLFLACFIFFFIPTVYGM